RIVRVLARICGGEVEGRFTLAPSPGTRIAFRIRRAEAAGADREAIRDARAIRDGARNPLAAGTFEQVGAGMIGDDESAAVAEINAVKGAAALPVAFDQRADNFGRFARGLRALQPKPDEVHPQQ